MDTPHDESMRNQIEVYIAQMSESEKIAYSIATKNLESSFDMEKSIGFIEYLQKCSTKDPPSNS